MCDAIHFVLRSSAASNKTFLLADREPISTSDMVAHLRLGAGLGARQTPVPPVVFQAILRLVAAATYGKDRRKSSRIRRALGTTWIEWRIKTKEGLRALGEISCAILADQRRDRQTTPFRKMIPFPRSEALAAISS